MSTQASNLLAGSRFTAKSKRPAFHVGLLMVLWSLFFLTAAWRALLSLQISFAAAGAFATGQAAVVIHWRRMDLLLGWTALLLLNLGRENTLRPASLGSARATRSFTLLAAFSLSLALFSIAADQYGFGTLAITDILSYLADFSLALTGLLTVFRELRSLARDISAGPITILHLWRLFATQWLLAWITAVVILRFTMKKDALVSNEAVRQLLFALPALGLLPNVLMSVGIRWWNALLIPQPHQMPAAQPRARAWILALFSLNLGALLMVVRIPLKLSTFLGLSQNAAASPGIPGALLILFAIFMYLTGFPPSAWKRTSASLGKPMLLAWIALLLAFLLILIERLLSMGTFSISLAFLAAAWRHLLTAAALLWLFAIAAAAQDRLLPERHRLAGRRAATLATLFLAAGAAFITILLLLASFAQGEAQTPRLRLLSLGALPELLALLIAGAALLRTCKLLRKETP